MSASNPAAWAESIRKTVREARKCGDRHVAVGLLELSALADYLAAPVAQPPVPNDWQHLRQYGYAPGHYMNTCRTCGQAATDVDKRAICCRQCAEKKHAQPPVPVPADELPTRADLIAGLKFYADGLHFDISSQPDAWDTVSGEPQNWWCDEAGTATIEDGSIAGMVLAGELTAAQIDDLGDGIEMAAAPQQAPAAPTAQQEPQK